MAFCDRSERRRDREKEPRNNLDKWDEALKYAQDAFMRFQAAESKREGKHIEDANILVERAMKALELRYGHMRFSPCIIYVTIMYYTP